LGDVLVNSFFPFFLYDWTTPAVSFFTDVDRSFSRHRTCAVCSNVISPDRGLTNHRSSIGGSNQ